MPKGWTALVCDSCGGVLEPIFNRLPGALVASGVRPSEIDELSVRLGERFASDEPVMLLTDSAEIKWIGAGQQLIDDLRCVSCKRIYQKDDN